MRVPVRLSLVLVVLVGGCSTSARTARSLDAFDASQREIRYGDYAREIQKCMKRSGFDYQVPPLRAAAKSLDFKKILDPSTIFNNVKNLQADGLGIDATVVENWRKLAALGPKGKALTTEEFQLQTALYGSVEKPGCEPKARVKFGGVSLLDAAEAYFSENGAKLEKLRSSENFRQLDRQFVRCSETEGVPFVSTLSYFETRKKMLEDFAYSKLETEPANQRVVDLTLAEDARIVTVFKNCVAPRSADLAEATRAVFGR
jgi:hypothetical protein